LGGPTSSIKTPVSIANWVFEVRNPPHQEKVTARGWRGGGGYCNDLVKFPPDTKKQQICLIL